MNDLALLVTLTCPTPTCGHQQRALMPTTFCQLSYTCEACSTTHTHKKGDCCVFCSYADTPCPSMQEEGTCSSLCSQDSFKCVRGTFCQQSLFFRSEEAALPWMALHPEAVLLSVEEAAQVGKLIAESRCMKKND